MSVVDARPPAVAGLFYTDDPALLRSSVSAMLDEATPVPDPPKALIAPHAGHIYSGPIAASAYAALAPVKESIRRVVLLGPSHYVPLDGMAVAGTHSFLTPLGEISIDRSAVELISGHSAVSVDDLPHAREHSLEVHLPFLQAVLDEFDLVPIVVGPASPDDVADVIELVWGGPETLVVVSSDLSHYHAYETARRLDRDTSTAIVELRVDEVEPDRACGAHPIAGLLTVARRRSMEVAALDVRNSGDTAGDRDRVVGYGAYALYEVPFGPLGAGDADQLVDLARDAVRAAVLGEPAPLDEVGRLPDDLLERRPAFVTLRRESELRGCVGNVEADEPLAAAVVRHAGNAVTDPRLLPVQPRELDDLAVGVSVLGPLERLVIESREDLEATLQPGVDGLLLRRGKRRSTFLPSVWNMLSAPADFVDHLLDKGGWPRDADLAGFVVHRYPAMEYGQH